MFPYDDITTRADRRWTFALLQRLLDPSVSDDERTEIVTALQALADPRSFPILESVVCDRDRPSTIRELASDILHGLSHVCYDPPDDHLRRWWREGDLTLRRHALYAMSGVKCPDILLEIARDAAHELQSLAISLMHSWFDQPEYHRIMIAGLSHPDPRVRGSAATVLMWDEPVAAEFHLLDATRDPDRTVVIEATNTLRYYPTRRVLRRLHELEQHEDDGIRQQAEWIFDEIRDHVRWAILRADASREHLRTWLDPVWTILDFTDEELCVEGESHSTPLREGERDQRTCDEILALLDDPETSPDALNESLNRADWSAFVAAERELLRAAFLSHGDEVVRNLGIPGLAAWQDIDALCALLSDPSFCIRKGAMYHLGTLPPNPALAEVAWDQLHRADTLGVHATETLGTFVHHAPRDLAIPRLAAIAHDPRRSECLHLAALYALMKFEAVEEIRGFLPRLTQPPLVTWSVHLTLLGAIAQFGLPAPDLTALLEVDDLNLHVALTEVLSQ